MLPFLLLLIERLRDAGTMRSLAVALFGMAGLPSPTEDLLQFIVYLAITLLGLLSALMRPQPRFVPSEVVATVQAARDLGEQVAQLRAVLAPPAVREAGR